MATREKVFDVLRAASGPLSREEFGEKVGQPVREWQRQLKGWINSGLIEDTGDQHFVITEKGREEPLPADHEELDGARLKEVRELAEDSHTMTDREKFVQLGVDAGMTNKGFLKGTTNLVWNRGDPRDLDSVWAGLKEANIDRDIASRWFNFWAAQIRKSIPINVARELSYNIGSKDKTDKEKTSLSHNIDEDGNPVYVGESLGALTHDEAFELAKIKAGAAKARGGGQAKGESPGDTLAAKAVAKVIDDMSQEPAIPVDETTKVLAQVKALKELLGLNGKPDSSDELTRLIAIIKSLKEITGENKQVVSPPPIKQLLYDKQTGKVEEVLPGQPIIIQSAPPQNPYIPIQMDKDGNPVVPPSLETWLRLEDFKGEQDRKKESHDNKMEIAKGFKDLLHQATTALSHTIEGKEEE